jgi:hypothetical protein
MKVSKICRALSITARGALTTTPVDVDLLGQSNGPVVVRDHARGLGVGAGEGYPVVEVEDGRRSAAGRRHGVGGRHEVLLGVDLAGGPDTAALDAGLGRAGVGGVAAEVVGGEEGAGDAVVQLRVAVVRAVGDGKPVAARIVQRQVQLAVLAAVHDGGAGSDVGLEAIETDGDDRPVGRYGGGHGALRTSVARVLDRGDGDLVRWRILVRQDTAEHHGREKEEAGQVQHVSAQDDETAIRVRMVKDD